MTIKTDKSTITKAYKSFEEISKQEQMIPVIQQFIQFSKIISEQIKPDTSDVFVEQCFDAVVDNVERRNDFISVLWIQYVSDITDVPKSKNTLDDFYTYCLNEISQDSITQKLENSDFEKIKKAVLAKIENLAGNNKQNWINLSKLTMGSLKEKSNAKQANPRNPISNNSDLQSSSVTESKQQPNS
ncbi:hypothetical protein AB6C47_018135 [Vibrio cyclitrophicus]